MRRVSRHQLQPSSDDERANVQCAVPACAILVAPEFVDDVDVPCPAPACPEPENDGEPCVFVPTEGGPACSYCGRAGAVDQD